MKHKFIERDKVKKLLDEGWYRGVSRNDIMCLPVTTEQEIVKPYLEKLVEIFENNKGYCCYDGDSYDYVNGKESGYDNCIDTVEDGSNAT